jgi:phosphohistidine phosphatase
MTKELRDENRFLTDEGVKSVAKISEKMAEMGRMPRLVITSPLVRAVQCAQMISGYAGRKSRVIVSDLLINGADLAKLREYLVGKAEDKRVMVVGHEPLLGMLIASLLQREEPFPLKKGSCVALEIDAEDRTKPAQFAFYLKPGKVPVSSLKKALAPSKQTEPSEVIGKNKVKAAAKDVDKSEKKSKPKQSSASRPSKARKPSSSI